MDLTVISAVAASVAAVAAIIACIFAYRSSHRGADAQEQEDSRLLAALDGQSRDIAKDLAQESALSKQRFESLERGLEQMGTKMDVWRKDNSDALEKGRQAVDVKLGEIRSVTDEKLTQTLTRQSADLRDHLGKFDERFNGFQTQIKGFQDQVAKGMGDTRETVEKQLGAIRDDNSKQLDRMRETVDEKLSKTLSDRLTSSFQQVTKSLDTVSKGLGEMQGIASGVGDLKRVLSNVKTRGILGEVQLAAILREILASDQYLEDVNTVPGSTERVEFAVKIPTTDGDPVLLPIDSKFPGDAYEHLRFAIEEGDADEIARARKFLEKQIKLEAKDICEKYISVPTTTNFGIMFLPFEGLYAEVVDMPGLIELLQRRYRVNVAGPSTMAAILNSLQMSYQTFALQQRADEIQKVLSAVKTELPKYQGELVKALRQIKTAEKTVDGLINRRTKAMERKLKTVTAMKDEGQARALLEDGYDSIIEAEPLDDLAQDEESDVEDEPQE